MSKRLLQINVTANWGSTGKIAEQIGLVAMQHGWESYIAYGRMMNPSKSKLIKIGSQWDVYMHYAMSRFFDMEGRMSKRATRRFVCEIEHIKPDVIHLHNIHDHYLNYPILFEYLAKADIPVVWTQHDQWATTGHCAFNLVGCRKWETTCGGCPLRGFKISGFRILGFDKSRENYELKKRMFTGVKSLTVVPVSDWLGREMQRSFLKEKPIRVIKNGIDIETFKPRNVNIRQQYGLDNKKIILGVASEWSERKGLPDMLTLAGMLPKDEYTIVIVGRVLQKENRVTSEGCNVIFIDRTQNVYELVQLYSAASVFVNPTYQDNYPTTNLEAMACGTPVITYRTGGSPESVDDETGAVVEQGDIEAIVPEIDRLTKTDVTGLSAACRNKAMRLFDANNAFGQYLSLYSKLAGGGVNLS